MSLRQRAPWTGVLSLAVAAVALLPVAAPVGALQITTFADGSTARLITFGPGGGVDSSASVFVAKNSYELAATMTVAGSADGGSHWPTDVSVYARAFNGSQIYGFTGTGYGAMGRQSLYSNGAAAGEYTFDGSGSASQSVLLPKNASTYAAGFSMTGEYADTGFVGPDYLNHKLAGGNSAQINTIGRGAPYLVDIDADGDLDLFAAGANFSGWNTGGPRFYRNNGTASSDLFQEEPGLVRTVAKDYGSSPGLADLDGDGDYDMIAVGSYCPGSYPIRYWRNTGSASSPTWTSNTSVFSGISADCRAHPAFADLDGDGDFDLTLGEEGGALTYLENTGNATAPAWTSSNKFRGINVGQNSAPAFADYDGDGDLDLVIGNGTLTSFGDQGGPTVLVYYRNDGSATASSFVKSDLFDAVAVGSNNTDTNVVPFLADLDADGDVDIVLADTAGDYWLYNGQRSAPTDVAVDVGADGSNDWTFTGTFLGTHQISGLDGAFNARLNATPTSITDTWGNQMVSIPIKVSTASGGVLKPHGLDIRYTFTASTIDFAGVLNRVRDGSTADGSGNIQMTIAVGSSSAGNVTLAGLSITEDLPPTATNPGVLVVLEDTKSDNVIDLNTVFVDDFTPSGSLTFEVTGNSAQGIIDAYIAGGRYLGIDAASLPAGDNWNGYLNVTVLARDARGLGTSITLLIWVQPVNDPPVIGNVLATYSILEDLPWSVSPNATDVDGDPTTWSIGGQPTGSVFTAATGVLSWTPLNKDVGSHSITLYLSDGQVTVQVSFSVVVVNVNDPPFILPIPNMTVFEGLSTTFDLTGFYGDEDDPPYTLVVIAKSAHVAQAGALLTIFFPKNSGVTAERVPVNVTDPHGASASRTFVITVIPSGPNLVLVGVPDVQVVETVPKTIDLAPYLYNVKNWDNVSMTASSAQVSFVGVKATFLYPAGFATDFQKVTFTAKEGDTASTWTITVTIVRLGKDLLIADLPDLDVAADQEMTLELAPYIHNVNDWSALTITVSSAYAWVTGTTLHLLYPRSASISVESVAVTVSDATHTSVDTLTVRVRSLGATFYLDAIPPITVVEGQPFVLFVSSYVHNPQSPTSTALSVASAYATVDGLQVSFLYPVGSRVEAEQVTFVARDGAQVFTTVVSVTVVSIGGAFALAGVPNIEVYTGAAYNLTLVPYLFNVKAGEIGTVVVITSSSYASVTPGPTVRFLYPKGANLTHETVKITAIYAGAQSNQTITVTVRPLGTRLTIAAVPEIHVTEDVAYDFDLAPYIFNAKSLELVVLAESAYATVHDGTVIRLLYPGGFTVDEFYVTVQAGSEFAQRAVRVFILDRNDAPRLLSSPTNWTGAPGSTVLWQLTAIFTDEENAAGLTFTSSDSRVTIDNVAKTATFKIPAEGVFRFTLTAVDGDNASLTTVSPEVAVTGRAGAPTGGRTAVASGAEDFGFALLFLALGAALTVLHRRDGGRAWGAQSHEPTLPRLVGRK